MAGDKTTRTRNRSGLIARQDGTPAPTLTPDWTEVTGKPGTFPPTAHSHTWPEVSKAGAVPGDVGAAAASHTHPWADVSKSGSSLADLATRAVANLSDGTNVPLLDAASNAFSGTLKERGRAIPIGEWADVAYAGGNFTGQGAMTWTVEVGDQATFAYTLIGKTAILILVVLTSSVGGTPNTYLQAAIPGGMLAAKASYTPVLAQDAGAGTEMAFCQTIVGAGLLYFGKLSGANWSASTNGTSLWCSVIFEVQ